MSRNTKAWFSVLILGSLLLVFLLYLVQVKENNFTFDAIVKEVYPNYALLEPIDSKYLDYSRVSANITGIKEGQKLKIVAKKEIKEVYPPIIEVVRYEIN